MSPATAPIWRDGAFHPDDWTRLAPGDPIPNPAAKILVGRSAFLADADRYLAHGGALGVEAAAGESVAELQPFLRRLDLIALVFPKFSDGRSYSAARLLRERYGYRGELRAVGDVLADQITLMRRCGITSFDVRHVPTRAALMTGRLAAVHRYYQPIADVAEAPAGARPWLRRPASPPLES
jgi:uncharacterized protein (DUF934 family)